MNQPTLHKCLLNYQSFWFDRLHNPFNEDPLIVTRFIELISTNKNPFLRESFPSHVTASCFVVNPTASQVLLLKHRKLNKWLQLGGHCDGNPETAQVAMREAQEESGSHHLTLINWQPDLPSIFVSDLDIHTIPNSPNKPSHFHFDVRYFAICALPHQLKREKREATDLRWFDWTAAEHITQEQSLHRPFKKFVMLATLFPQALSTIGKTA